MTPSTRTIHDLPAPPSGATDWPWNANGPPAAATMADGSPWPRISIVTPSFNQAGFLEETIRSVLLQGYPNLEYIVIDGGSTDRSPEILERYGEHLTYWVSEPDRGQTHAINKGFARATGEILAYLNSDDHYQPGALLALAEAFHKAPDADVIYGRLRYMAEDGTPQEVHAGRLESFADIADVWYVWWCGRQFVQPEVFWRRRIAEACGLFREDLYYVMDYEYWLRMAAKGGRFVHFPRELASFRRTENQKSQAAENVAREHLTVLKDYLWDAQMPLTRRHRRRMQADYLFDAHLRTIGDEHVAHSTGAARRWSHLLAFCARNPRVFASPLLHYRIGHWVLNRLNLLVGRKPR